MGKESRMKAAAPEITLAREDVPAVAILALMDALMIDMQRTAALPGVGRDLRMFRQQVAQKIRGDVERLHGTYKGRVTDGLIINCDRYLCRVQDALDTFFDDITEEDLEFIEATKAKWPQGEGT